MNFDELVKNTMLRDAALRDAFIVEELKPFLVKEGDELIYTQQLRVRLAEIADFKQRVKEAIKEHIGQGYDEYPVTEYVLGKLYEELGL